MTAQQINIFSTSEALRHITLNDAHPLHERVQNFIRLIKNDIEKQDMEMLFDKMFMDVYVLRGEILKSEYTEKTPIQSIVSEPAVTYTTRQHTELREALPDLRKWQKEIASHLTAALPDHPLRHLRKPADAYPTYGSIELLSLLPNPRVQYIKKLFDKSLELEFGIFISELVLDKTIEMTSERSDQELRRFTKKALLHFGAYAIFTEFWEPTEEQEMSSGYVNSMAILGSVTNANHGLEGMRISKERLYHLTHG